MKQANPKARMMSEQTIIAMISAVPRPPPESGPEADEAPIYALASEFANAKAKQSLIVWCLTTSLSIWINLFLFSISNLTFDVETFEICQLHFNELKNISEFLFFL